jgi:capsular exopolysaccharide synthesis family protein
MSRIEEALRRAAVPSGTRGPHSLKEAPALGIEPTLTTYPPEAPAAAARPRRADSVPKAVPADPRHQRKLPSFPQAMAGKLILNHAPPVAVEQYRRLAATLHELQSMQQTKTLMVTSTVPREGKSLTVTNLALTMSESYQRRVLLIDADLRRPSLHETFGLRVTSGLSDVLKQDSGNLPLVHLSEHLSILPAGRVESNPMAGLTSDRMRALIEEAAEAFDWVLLDAPPVGIMPDANLLARLTQGVIFVVAAGMTPYKLVARAIADIGRDSIVGVVLNRMDADSIPQSDYYQEYYGAPDTSD